jgi:radical SAM protein with 4Fe4S-binding SPASM domain
MNRRPIQDCYFPWAWLNIDARGNVKPCCHATLTVGNINQQSVEEIWNGELMARLRGAIHDGYIDPICRHSACSFVQATEAAFGAHAYDTSPCLLDTEYSLANGQTGARFCSSGWADPEAWGVWSAGHKAILTLDMPPESSPLTLKVLCRGIGNHDHQPPDVILEVDGRPLDLWRFRYPEEVETFGWKMVAVPAREFDGSPLKLCFRIERPLSPTLWNGGDGRQLGIAISALIVSSYQHSEGGSS